MVDDGGEGEALDPPVDDLPGVPVTPSRWWIAAAASILIALAFPYVWQAFAPVDGPRMRSCAIGSESLILSHIGTLITHQRNHGLTPPPPHKY